VCIYWYVKLASLTNESVWSREEVKKEYSHIELTRVRSLLGRTKGNINMENSNIP